MPLISAFHGLTSNAWSTRPHLEIGAPEPVLASRARGDVLEPDLRAVGPHPTGAVHRCEGQIKARLEIGREAEGELGSDTEPVQGRLLAPVVERPVASGDTIDVDVQTQSARRVQVVEVDLDFLRGGADGAGGRQHGERRQQQ